MDDIVINSEQTFLEVAKSFAASDFEVSKKEEKIKPEEINLVWFNKTIQNYKAILFAPRAVGAKLVEVTYNGDENDVYFDYYQKTLKTTLHLG